MQLTQRAAQQDILQLSQILSASHPDPYQHLGGAVAFHRSVQSLLDAVPEAGLSDEELYVYLRPLAASLGDTHTALWPPTDAVTDNAQPPAILPRLWLDMEPIEDQLYVSRVYSTQHRFLLGARLAGLSGIALPQLRQRMQLIRGCDNLYGTSVALALALTTPTDLAVLLNQDASDLLAHAVLVDLVTRDGTALHVDLPLLTQAPGAALEPASVVPLPQLSSIQMGWSFLTPDRSVACLRIDSLISYREAFEYARALGIASTLRDQLARAACLALGQEPPAEMDAQIAAVPSVTELLRDLFAAMQNAQTPHLLVDMRRCPGGNSLASLILEYFLYGTDSMLAVEEGYQIPRYSPLYLAEYQSHTPAELERIECCLQNGGYDFSGERAWEQRQQSGLTQAVRDHRLDELRELVTHMPTFASVFEKSEWSRAWSPQVLALTSAHTASAGLDVVAQLVLHGAHVVGIPSSQGPTCFIGGLPFTLEHSGLRGMVAHKWSALFPTDPNRTHVLQPDIELTYEHLVGYNFDPNATVRLTLEHVGLHANEHAPASG